MRFQLFWSLHNCGFFLDDRMGTVFRATVSSFFLVLLLSPLGFAASNDGLLRVGLKKRKLDQLDRLSAQYSSKGVKSMRKSLRSYGLGNIVGSDDNENWRTGRPG